MTQDQISPVETADGIGIVPNRPQDALLPQRSALPPVDVPVKLPVMGVPTDAEAKLVTSDHTRWRKRSKYRSWA